MDDDRCGERGEFQCLAHRGPAGKGDGEVGGDGFPCADDIDWTAERKRWDVLGGKKRLPDPTKPTSTKKMPA